jgi:hypothetical protein
MQPHEHTKKVCLCEDVHDKLVSIARGWPKKRRIEDHVWFEDRWMVASLCDEWLTTLCGLILG